jgi:signal peptidase
MELKRVGESVLSAALLVVVASVILGSVTGQPILLSYVETGSMAPTMEPGDGFVAIPTELDGSIEPGDVVMFEAEEIQGGGLTTHRVVGRAGDGYVTKGDANPFTDQDSHEPPVRSEQVVAKALQVNGDVLVIPHIGTVAEGAQAVAGTVQRHLAGLLGSRSLLGAQGLAYVFFAGTLIWYLVGEVRQRDERRPERNPSRSTGTDVTLIITVCAAMLVLGATAAMTVPAGPQKYSIVSAEFYSDRPTVIPTGESKDLTYTVGNDGAVGTVVFLEPGSDQVEIAPHEHHLGPRETANATLTLHAPPETGYYRRYVTEHRYLALLPTSTIRTLYEIHPWLPVVVIDAMIAGAFLALTLPFVGSGRIRDRSRDGARRSILTRLVR